MKDFFGRLAMREWVKMGKMCLRYAWSKICVWQTNTKFAHKMIHMYAREDGSIKSIEFVTVNERLRLHYTHTHHHLVICRIGGFFHRWRHRVTELRSVLESIKVENLQDNNVTEEVYTMPDWNNDFTILDEIRCVREKRWSTFKEGVGGVATEVCGNLKIYMWDGCREYYAKIPKRVVKILGKTNDNSQRITHRNKTTKNLKIHFYVSTHNRWFTNPQIFCAKPFHATFQKWN